MTTFLLIRHGACDPMGKTLAGWTPGVSLNDSGRAQARQLAGRLARVPITGIYSSPLQRAQETAEPLSASVGVPVEVVEAFGEVRFGEWTGCSLDALGPEPAWKRFNHLRSVARAPGGETMLEVQARGLAELERIRERQPEGVCAVFSHGDVIKSIIAHCAGIPLDLFHRLEVSPASISIVRVSDWHVEVSCVNDTGDLWPA